jgi:hypothetical protein
MKNLILKSMALAAITMGSMVGCKKNDGLTVTPTSVAIVPTPIKTTTYELVVKDLLGVTGFVSFAETSPGSSSSIISIQLVGSPVGSHPAHVHFNAAIETGDIAYVLSSVDSTGKSSTTLSVSYATLVGFDGYVNVYLDPQSLRTIIAQGDIGGNQLTGISSTFNLFQDSTSGVSGFAKFEQRKNNTTLVSVDLNSGDILPNGLYPALINLGSVATIGSPVVRTLTSVNGATRKSITNVRKLNGGIVITYDNWMMYDGFVSIQDAAENRNIISKGDIGLN